MKPFKVLKTEKLVWKPYCKVEQQLVEIPDGDTRDWYVFHNENAVIIVPVLEDGSVLLQRNYKHGSGEIVTEFPAGMMDQGETPAVGAARELLEETGYSAQSFEWMQGLFVNPTSSPMKHHMVLARNCASTNAPEREPEEQIEPFLLPNLEVAIDLLLQKETLTSEGTVAAALCALRFLD